MKLNYKPENEYRVIKLDCGAIAIATVVGCADDPNDDGELLCVVPFVSDIVDFFEAAFAAEKTGIAK